VDSRLTISCALLAGLAMGCAQATPHAAARASKPASQLISLDEFDHMRLARAIFGETNRVRAEHGVSPLAPSPALDGAADEQASYMALMLSMEHGNPIPGEHSVADRVAHAGLDALRVGENLIMVPAQRPAGSAQPDYTYAAFASLLVDKWMDSPAHRATLLDPGYTHLGCAARLAHGVLSGDNRVFATQVFFLALPGDAAKG